MNDVRALVLAAGKGQRMGTEQHKQFLEYHGKPLFLWSVLQFLRCKIPVTLVTGEEDIEEMQRWIRKFETELLKTGMELPQVIRGGRERYESSYRGLLHLKADRDCEIVLIHDAARPFVTEETIRSCVACVRACGSAVAAVPSKDTVKIADSEGFVETTPPRENVYVIQTPQGFYLQELLEAYEKMLSGASGAFSVTDDASVLERAGNRKIKLFTADYGNIKITTPEDLVYLK